MGMSTAKDELHELINALPEAKLTAVKDFLQAVNEDVEKDPFEDMDPDERERLHAILAQNRSEHKAGLGIPADEALARLRAR